MAQGPKAKRPRRAAFAPSSQSRGSGSAGPLANGPLGGSEGRGFLTKGGVFTDSYIDAYIDLKMQEVTRFRMATHPVEFDMYYTL